jgi:hypothetical protein
LDEKQSFLLQEPASATAPPQRSLIRTSGILGFDAAFIENTLVPAITKMTGGDAPLPEVPVTEYAVHNRVPA